MLKSKKPIVFDQGDQRWGENMYSIHNDKYQTMRRTGSAPTLAADVVATLKGEDVTPWDLAQLALETGYRSYMSGTTYGFFEQVFKRYGIRGFVRSTKFDSLTACLDAGGLVICSMKAGYWSPVWNYILAWDYDDKYVYCVESYKSKRDKQPIDDFKKDAKMFFCFYPDDWRAD